MFKPNYQLLLVKFLDVQQTAKPLNLFSQFILYVKKSDSSEIDVKLIVVVSLSKTVRRKLPVHPPQPDVPAGGRSSGSVQQDHGFGQARQQKQQPGWGRPHRLLQPAEQVAGAWGANLHVRDKQTHLRDVFNVDSTLKWLVEATHSRLLVRLDVCHCHLVITPVPPCDSFVSSANTVPIVIALQLFKGVKLQSEALFSNLWSV